MVDWSQDLSVIFSAKSLEQCYASKLIIIINIFFNQVIEAHFYFKKDEILAQCEGWIKDSESLLSGRTVGRAISHHVQSLKQNTALLKQELAKLEPPPEHIPDDQDTDDDSD